MCEIKLKKLNRESIIPNNLSYKWKTAILCVNDY